MPSTRPGWLLRLAFGALGVTSAAAGCNVIAGLDQFQICDGAACGDQDATTPDVVESDSSADVKDGTVSDVYTDAREEADAGAVDASDCGPTDTVQNCTACGITCDAVHSKGASCDFDAGGCVYTGCNAGWGDCDKDPHNANGCETPLDTTANCTACGAACDTTHSVGAACNADGGTCTYTACMAGWGDCNKTAPDTDGCETSLTTTSDCSGCGLACDTAHSVGASCNGTTCSYTACAAGYADCNKTAPDTDGCETVTDTTSNCSACGDTCNGTHSTSTTCNGTTCSYNCTSGWADCNTTPPNTGGCVTSLSTTSNCGGCGNQCDTTTSTGASCNGTTCSYSGCDPGYADCNTTAPDTNGCETATNTITNCSGCGLVCDKTTSLGASCNGTTCKYTGCAGGYADCNATAPDTNGCETQTTTTANCGGCGNTCDTTHSTGASCTGTSCAYSGCNSGYVDCNSTAPNTGGCSCATATSASQGTVNGCCPGLACQNQHSDGIGQSYFDCTPAGTYNATQALEACTASTGDATQCTSGYTCTGADGGVDETLMCSDGASTCDCWDYSGTQVGHVSQGGPPMLGGCLCALSTDPAWN